MTDMEGGCMSISSLGAIGGTGFTPIVNAPEVAILGITKAEWKPRRAADDGMEWRLKAPLSLSYDHRVINGADAARFLRHLDDVLAKPEQL
jgi:pyruvate dehydrogenase E2 component (dihydrolipoamide acetyltransferase)